MKTYFDKVLLVGEQNPYGADPFFALYPEPAGCAGWRLAKILGMSKFEYLDAFARCNLLEGRWSAPRAREAASQLVHARRILLGARVSAAHGVEFRPFLTYHGPSFSALVLPHPSGRCRIWNEPGSAERARQQVRWFSA